MPDTTPGRLFKGMIQHAVWLYHRFSLNDWDVQEVRHQHGLEVSHDTLREGCIPHSALSSLRNCATGNPGGP
ncbi:hypothetical protein [Deinococcus sp. QL22]|uniref:hypothetical protein n=1 Tax=Deinococcus sp. QL22 TaxID=2939437 RepID=UPI002017A912|nr:hypothetical protein [Deinococcus sp. QL22]UQN08288.1 hypothetical protein M1R55_16245 [Deinococcus sp. QL22]